MEGICYLVVGGIIIFIVYSVVKMTEYYEEENSQTSYQYRNTNTQTQEQELQEVLEELREQEQIETKEQPSYQYSNTDDVSKMWEIHDRFCDALNEEINKFIQPKEMLIYINNKIGQENERDIFRIIESFKKYITKEICKYVGITEQEIYDNDLYFFLLNYALLTAERNMILVTAKKIYKIEVCQLWELKALKNKYQIDFQTCTSPHLKKGQKEEKQIYISLLVHELNILLENNQAMLNISKIQIDKNGLWKELAVNELIHAFTQDTVLDAMPDEITYGKHLSYTAIIFGDMTDIEISNIKQSLQEL